MSHRKDWSSLSCRIVSALWWAQANCLYAHFYIRNRINNTIRLWITSTLGSQEWCFKIIHNIIYHLVCIYRYYAHGVLTHMLQSFCLPIIFVLCPLESVWLTSSNISLCGICLIAAHALPPLALSAARREQCIDSSQRLHSKCSHSVQVPATNRHRYRHR